MPLVVREDHAPGDGLVQDDRVFIYAPDGGGDNVKGGLQVVRAGHDVLERDRRRLPRLGEWF